MTAATLHLALAGLFGASGVALWAYATHAGQPTAAIAAQMLVIHAGALAALTTARAAGLLPARAAAILIAALALGVALFAGDLAARALIGQRLFPMASPLGGVLMIGAWLGLALAALFRPRG
jgi:uncharacterized membrane protein YgdD (TMEM256/DUF423 family)